MEKNQRGDYADTVKNIPKSCMHVRDAKVPHIVPKNVKNLTGRMDINMNARSKSDADESSNACVECGRQCDTKRCARCKSAFYCSVRCQKTHWPHHKLFCHKETVPQEPQPSSTTASPICAYCRVNDCSVSCESCKLVFYCSQNCQMKDLEKHKSLCRKKSVRNKETLSEDLCTIMGLVTPEEHGGINSNDTKQFPDFQKIGESYARGLHCNKCGKKDNVRPCKRCKSTTYCSTACENSDNHEKKCRSMQFLNSLPGRSVKSGQSDSGLYVATISNFPPHSWLSNKDPMLAEDGADLNLIVERSDEDRQKAILCVKQKQSFQSLITRVREIPMEEMSISGSNICHIPNAR
ncbi:uncharacterized protein LOC125676085 [Ostrea edulis]|uniref:uncharacterized protein LOC125676085 n=1 Tax=Ostrea edulis TaxID=37623 RepID=UPI0024AE8A44|nr:uncharacterized protein LOC125676085 [Ostrea edulis]